MEPIACPICATAVSVRATRSARGKVALMLACPRDGRHFRAFINDAAFVAGVVDRLETSEAGDFGAAGGHRGETRSASASRARETAPLNQRRRSTARSLL